MSDTHPSPKSQPSAGGSRVSAAARAEYRRIAAGLLPLYEPIRLEGPGERLADYRRGGRGRAATAAARAGYDWKTVWRIERGVTANPPQQTRIDLAQALGVAVEEIWR